jgi:hypothetical protein
MQLQGAVLGKEMTAWFGIPPQEKRLSDIQDTALV